MTNYAKESGVKKEVGEEEDTLASSNPNPVHVSQIYSAA